MTKSEIKESLSMKTAIHKCLGEEVQYREITNFLGEMAIEIHFSNGEITHLSPMSFAELYK